MTNWLNVGKIVNTHGIRGEVRVISRTDFPEQRYAEGNILHVADEKGNRAPLTVSTWRKHKQFDLLTFKGLDNVNDVEQYKGYLLQVNSDDIDDDLSEDEYYYHEIVGAKVITEDGDELGKVKEILSPGANDVWVVQRSGKGKDILLPYIKQVIKKVDIDKKEVVVHLMEGLVE